MNDMSHWVKYFKVIEQDLKVTTFLLAMVADKK